MKKKEPVSCIIFLLNMRLTDARRKSDGEEKYSKVKYFLIVTIYTGLCLDTFTVYSIHRLKNFFPGHAP